MEFEFETRLRNGREVSVAGQKSTDSIEYDSVMDLSSGVELIVDDRLRKELDFKTREYLWKEMKDKS